MEMSAILQIISYGIWGAAGAIVALSALRGLLRKTALTLGGLVAAIVDIPLSLFLTKSFLGKTTTWSLASATADMSDLSAAIPSLPATIGILGAMLFRPILFLLLYLVLLVLLRFVWWVLAPMVFGKMKHHPLIGTAIGAVTGVIVAAMVLMPVVGTAGVVRDTLAGFDSGTGETALPAEVTDIRNTVDEVQKCILSHPVTGVARSVSGGIYTGLTSLSDDGNAYALNTEFSAVGKIAGIALPLVYADWNDVSSVPVDVLDRLPDAVKDSSLLKATLADVLSGLSDAWLSGRPYLGVEKPEIEDIGDIALQTVLMSLRNTTVDNVEENLRMLCGTAKTILPLIGSRQSIEKITEDPEVLVDILGNLFDNGDISLRRMAVEAGLEILADRLGLSEDASEITAAFADELAALSDEGLSLADTASGIKELNEKYQIGMSDEECESIAAVIQEDSSVFDLFRSADK